MHKKKTHSILCVWWWEHRHNVLYYSWMEDNLGTRDINIREPNLIMMYSQAQSAHFEYMFMEYICFNQLADHVERHCEMILQIETIFVELLSVFLCLHSYCNKYCLWELWVREFVQYPLVHMSNKICKVTQTLLLSCTSWLKVCSFRFWRNLRLALLKYFEMIFGKVIWL